MLKLAMDAARLAHLTAMHDTASGQRTYPAPERKITRSQSVFHSYRYNHSVCFPDPLEELTELRSCGENATCPVCSDEFNSTENIPKDLIGCTHTICSVCVKRCIEWWTLTCPVCQISSELPLRNRLGALATNYSILEKRGRPSGSMSSTCSCPSLDPSTTNSDIVTPKVTRRNQGVAVRPQSLFSPRSKDDALVDLNMNVLPCPAPRRCPPSSRPAPRFTPVSIDHASKFGQEYLACPQSVVRDGRGVLYVSDNNDGSVQQFTLNEGGKSRRSSSSTLLNLIGQTRRRKWSLGKGRVRCASVDLATSPDGRYFACCRGYVDARERFVTTTILIIDMEEETMQKLKDDSHLAKANHIAFDHNRRLLVSSTGSGCVHVYDEDENRKFKFVTKVGSKGTGPDQLMKPTSVCCGPDDEIIVSDRGNRRVQVYDRAGQHLRSIGDSETSVDDVDSPAGLHVDSHGRLLVCDDVKCVVYAYDLDTGAPIACLDVVQDPLKTPVDIISLGHNQSLVVDSGNHCIRLFQYEITC